MNRSLLARAKKPALYFISIFSAIADMAVPVIDLAKLKGAERKATMAQIDSACQDWGFFQLLNHGIPHDLLDRVQEMCKRNYENFIDEEFKKSAPVKLLQNAQRDPSNEFVIDADWEHVFFINHNQTSAVSSPLPGDFNEEAIQEFANEIRKLAESVLEIMCENLGLEKGYLKEALSGGDKPVFGTKVSHYPPCPRPDLINGLRAHTDAGGLILLFQDDKVAGLQALKDGHWVDVQPLRHAIVIDIGDQLEVISNGKYKSNWHRVLAMEDGNRMSVASFYNPSINAMVYPAPQLTSPSDLQVEEDYPRFLSADYMSIYAHQKYLAKEPRFEAMKLLEATN